MGYPGNVEFQGEFVLLEDFEFSPFSWPSGTALADYVVGHMASGANIINMNSNPVVVNSFSSTYGSANHNFGIVEGNSIRVVSSDDTFADGLGNGYAGKADIGGKFYEYLEVTEVGNPTPIALGTQTYDLLTGQVVNEGVIPNTFGYPPVYAQYPTRLYEYVDNPNGTPFCITTYLTELGTYEAARFYANGEYSAFYEGDGSREYFDESGYAWTPDGLQYFKAAIWRDESDNWYPRIMRFNEQGIKHWDIVFSRVSDNDYLKAHPEWFFHDVNANMWKDGQGVILRVPDTHFGGYMFYAFDAQMTTYKIYRFGSLIFAHNGGIHRTKSGDILAGTNLFDNAYPEYNYRLNRMKIMAPGPDNSNISTLPVIPIPCYNLCIPLLKGN